jgi:hypothetical protein
MLNKSSPLKLLGQMEPIWPSSVRGEDFFNISQSEKRIALGGHICMPNGTK